MTSSACSRRGLKYDFNYPNSHAADNMCISRVGCKACVGQFGAFMSFVLRGKHFRCPPLLCELLCEIVRPEWFVRSKNCSFSLGVGGCAGCGVTIARANVSRMDPNHKMLSSQHVSPPGQGEISQLLMKTMGLVSLKHHWLGNTCTVKIMNVPLFNTFPCCKIDPWTWTSVRIPER